MLRDSGQAFQGINVLSETSFKLLLCFEQFEELVGFSRSEVFRIEFFRERVKRSGVVFEVC
jgi:hypothetical protein